MALSTTITNLTTRRDAIATELAAITSSSSAGPDFSIDGVSINWDAHKTALMAELKSLTEMIELFNGPCIVYTQGV